MAVSKNPLGMNARNFLYIRRYNPRSAKIVADDKLLSKRLLMKNNISTPKLISSFSTRDQIRSFDWQLPPDGFVIKPARGYGGEGILAFRKWEDAQGKAVTGDIYTKQQIESHLLDILEGAYSLQFLPDKVLVEELVRPDPFFRKLAAVGLPDIRIIVFNHIPIMAMMRLPTKESGGKANIHLGALALGIDLRTGITTYGLSKGKQILTIPNSKVKVRGIKIPNWEEILLLGTNTQAICGLGYAGIDIVVDAKKGPMVLELNARPGLSIQNANMVSLRNRIERVEDMPTPTPKRGVEVAKSLFAEPFSEKVDTGPKVLSFIEPIIFRYGDKQKTILAKLDTGAYRTSVDKSLARELNIPVSKRKILIKAANSIQNRLGIEVTFFLAGKKITTDATITDRSHLKYQAIIGRRDLKEFLVSPRTKPEVESKPDSEELDIQP